MLHRVFSLAALSVSFACAAIPTCPAGLPIGAIQLRVSSAPDKSPLSIHVINRVEEGDTILYSPVLRANEKRSGKIAVVLVPASKQEKRETPFVILDPKPADKAAQWKVPFRVSLAAYVYGPTGLSVGKVKVFLAKDDELISQLAEYAAKTEKTEALLQALASMPEATPGQDMSAALQGFAGQYGISNQIDRTAPSSQQTLAMMRGLNPALSNYDPISPQGSQRLGQTASLATVVAGMFFGSTVGLAAGGAAMVMNLETLMFPNAEFRSSFAQPAPGDSLGMCGKRDPTRGRTRLAFLWAVRIPNSGAPHVTINGQNHIPLGLKSTVKVDVPESEWPLVDRVRNWTLGNSAVGVKAVAPHALEIDLSKAPLAAGRYELKGDWDWDPFTAKGEIDVQPLSSFTNAHLSDESHDRLVQHAGKQIVQLEGDDFEFVQKVALSKVGDKFDSPSDVPFSLPLGPRGGTQDRLEMRIDAGPLDAGSYALLLVQDDGKTHNIPLQVVPEPPKIDHLPIAVNAGDAKQEITIHGQHLDRISKIDAGAVKMDLGSAAPDGTSRKIGIELPADAKEGEALDMHVSVDQYARPMLLPGALMFAGPKPRLIDAKLALPGDLEVALKPGELPSGVFVSAMVRVQNMSANTAMRLFCKNGESPAIVLRAGEQHANIKLQTIGSDSVFLSFDPGAWVTGCSLMATLDNAGEEPSPAYRFGRVVRIPRIESFRLTDEPAGDGNYSGILTGRDLEVIAKTGWDTTHGTIVGSMATPIAGLADKQSLKIAVPWPSPAPHAPIYVWLRGDKEGRATTVKY